MHVNVCELNVCEFHIKPILARQIFDVSDFRFIKDNLDCFSTFTGVNTVQCDGYEDLFLHVNDDLVQ